MTDMPKATEQVVEAVMKAWADNDAAAFATNYAVAATVVLPGILLRGRAEIEAAMARAFAGELKGSQRRHLVQEVRTLAEDIAVMFTRSATIRPEEAERSPDLWPLAAWVLSRTTGTWLVESYVECPAN
jgi:uncharacterized protein (TIGR02246 family)